MRSHLCLLVAFAASAANAALQSPTFVIDMGLHAPALDLQTEFAVQSCVGLFNRNPSKYGGYAYTLKSADDASWLQSTGFNTTTTTSSQAFLTRCLSGQKPFPAPASGYILYNMTQQKVIVPNLATLAGVLDAVPLESSALAALGLAGTAPVLDATTEFPYVSPDTVSSSPRKVTRWVFDRYASQTSGIAKMDPGLDTNGPNKLNPPLTGNPKLGLVDYIVKEKLFNFFLNLGCLPYSEDHALMERIATEGPWEKPLRVMGYDNTFAFAGDLFEAETDCVKQHDMGQIASDGCSNLAFFSGDPAISTPLAQNPQLPTSHLPYNSSLTYVTLLIGDGDNVNYVKGMHYHWMQQRVSDCQQNPANCYPLGWTQSPAVLRLAPAWMRWYFNEASKTGRDWFVLPPSGDTYSYPSQQDPANQATFIERTERDAWLMNTTGTVSWEFMGTWEVAIDKFFPRFAAAAGAGNGTIQACFAVNVPYMIPVLAFKEGEHYKLIESGGGKVVLFKPREWRGADPSAPIIERANSLTAQELADEISGYAPGSVSHIYATSDGGFDLTQLDDMVSKLGEHVRVVSPQEAAVRALQRG